MVTLMSWTTSAGTRRCDARCYNAKRPKCDCICGGRNHGVGLLQAQANVRARVAGTAEILRWVQGWFGEVVS